MFDLPILWFSKSKKGILISLPLFKLWMEILSLIFCPTELLFYTYIMQLYNTIYNFTIWLGIARGILSLTKNRIKKKHQWSKRLFVAFFLLKKKFTICRLLLLQIIEICDDVVLQD